MNYILPKIFYLIEKKIFLNHTHKKILPPHMLTHLPRKKILTEINFIPTEKVPPDEYIFGSAKVMGHSCSLDML